jgi:hypothetical protein
MDQPVFIHVGFANTGTTSLQRNFFGKRNDIFFAGEPYGERGGIFTAIKCVEDLNFNAEHLIGLCTELIAAKSHGRTIVISDEALCEAPQLYISPFVMPRDAIALRLKEFFPSAKVVFTIRDQRHYVVSMYLNLKRNSAKFHRMPIPSFSHWLAGHLAQTRSHFLQNLNFLETIRLYEAVFGHDNICILPLELLQFEGPVRYLGKLSTFMGLQLSERDMTDYATIHNRRMSIRQELVAELLAEDRFARLFAELNESIGAEQLDAVLDNGPRAVVEVSPEEEKQICHRVAVGNWLLARDFGLDLERWGYPCADESRCAEQLMLARHEQRYHRDIEGLCHAAHSQPALEIRRSAEIVALRSRLQHLAAELDAVGGSPVWRTVRFIDGARRSLSRAAASILSLI